MTIKLKKNNLVLLMYVILSALYTSPLFDMQFFDYVLYFLFLFNWCFIVLGLFYAYKNADIKVILSLVFIVMIIFIICMLNGTDLRQCNVILALIIGMYYTTSISYSKDFYRLIGLVGIIYNFVSLICSPDYFVDWGESSGTMMNPNTIGIMNLFFAIIVNSYIHLFVSNKKKCYILYNAIMLYLLFAYRSRTAQVAFLVFIVLFVLFTYKIVVKSKLLYVITCLLSILGLIVPLIYVTMPKEIMNWIADLTGKPYFSGREIIWARFYYTLRDIKTFLLGPGLWRKEEFTTLWNNGIVYSMHNNYLDIILCFGGIGFIIFTLFISTRIYFLSEKQKINNYVCLSGYFSFMILGYAENNFNYAFFVMLYNVLIGLSIYANQYELKSTWY